MLFASVVVVVELFTAEDDEEEEGDVVEIAESGEEGDSATTLLDLDETLDFLELGSLFPRVFLVQM